jgi:predicted lipid-binding transport protein (Tim44 family)
MGDAFQFLDIPFFAAIAIFLAWRLYRELGRRTGEERQRPNPFPTSPERRGPVMRARGPVVDVEPVVPKAEDIGPISVAAGLRLIAGVDAGFDEKHFLTGARGAFTLIVNAFARGDSATLRPLLNDDVYNRFLLAIRDRQGRGQTLETRIEAVDEVDFVEAWLEGKTAKITLRIRSHQANSLHDATGLILEGEDGSVVEVVDIWTFARNVNARDPNWILIETRVGT